MFDICFLDIYPNFNIILNKVITLKFDDLHGGNQHLVPEGRECSVPANTHTHLFIIFSPYCYVSESMKQIFPNRPKLMKSSSRCITALSFPRKTDDSIHLSSKQLFLKHQTVSMTHKGHRNHLCGDITCPCVTVCVCLTSTSWHISDRPGRTVQKISSIQ